MSAQPATKEVVVELVTIGREILDGRVIDTNAVALAEALKAIGLVARYGSRVDDQLDRIVETFAIASARAEVVLVTGGLGPTSDDLTAQAFAKFRGEPLVLDEKALAHVTAVLARAGRALIEPQKKQAFLPQSCFMLDNPEGTAPGFAFVEGHCAWFFMPGVPREMKRMLAEQVIPRLAKSHGQSTSRTHTWATQFTSEGQLQERLTPVEKKLPPGFEVTYRTRFPENHVGLHAILGDAPERARAFDDAAAEIGKILAAEVFTETQGLAPLKNLEEVVVERLAASGAWLSTVESCTGGQVAARITGVAGSSRVYWGSHVVYDNAAKELLGVPTELLVSAGAVSPDVARKLAELGLEKMRARPRVHVKGTKALCVSTTGIAGPTGGTAEKPVGLCYIAVAIEGAETQVHEIRARIGWGRDYNRTFFAQKALELVRQATLGRG